MFLLGKYTEVIVVAHWARRELREPLRVLHLAHYAVP